ncbi:hypothetical protein TGPRC2_282030 [Toxoplasma gondii TgCatPRC2]|uniref:ODAD1 central coiled coil region domain-containing protein n=1 Tax=Toxoplasma gondii TgCatPRC2 TaxID=1130821 RepID=A0A151HBK3_TOXGO|nr:hypothetical protein TGPRC2_282030 [Toxoplasma gondii TgCatPRC2]
MPPTLALEEQYEDLLKRFQIMDAERKTTYEAAQNAIRYNQGLMKQLKDENIQIRNQIKLLKKNKILTAPEHLQKKMDEVSRLRLQLDQMKNHNVGQRRTLASLQDKLRELEIAAERPNTEASPELKQIRVIENRLDQAMIKLNEAQSIRSTYEQIVKRLKDERLGLDQHLAQLEKTLKEKDNDYEELLALSHDATHASELAQAELHRVSQAIEQERAHREQEVEEKRALVQACVTANQKLVDEALATKQKVEEDRLKAMAQVKESNITDGNDAPTLDDYENVFRRIKEATGVSDVNEVIQKFLMQEETRESLVSLAKELEEMKLSSVTKQSKWPVVDDLEISACQANARHERARSKYEKNCQLLVELQAGLEHLYEKLMSTTQTNPHVRRQASATQPTVEWMVQASLQKLDYLVKRTTDGLKREQECLQEEKNNEQAADHARQIDSLLSPGSVEKSATCDKTNSPPGNDECHPSAPRIFQKATAACVDPVFDDLPPAASGQEAAVAMHAPMYDSKKIESPSASQVDTTSHDPAPANAIEEPSSLDVPCAPAGTDPERKGGQQTNAAQTGFGEKVDTERGEKDVHTSSILDHPLTEPLFPPEDEGQELPGIGTVEKTDSRGLEAKYGDRREVDAATEENKRGDTGEEIQRGDDIISPRDEACLPEHAETGTLNPGNSLIPDKASPVSNALAVLPSGEADTTQQPNRVSKDDDHDTFEPGMNEVVIPVTDGGEEKSFEVALDDVVPGDEQNKAAEKCKTESDIILGEALPGDTAPRQQSPTSPSENCEISPEGPNAPESNEPLSVGVPLGPPESDQANLADGDDGELHAGDGAFRQAESVGVGADIVSTAQESPIPDLPPAHTAQPTIPETQMIEMPGSDPLAPETATNQESDARTKDEPAYEGDSSSGSSQLSHPEATKKAGGDACKVESEETQSDRAADLPSRRVSSSEDPDTECQDSFEKRELQFDFDTLTNPVNQRNEADLASDVSHMTIEGGTENDGTTGDTHTLAPPNSDQQATETALKTEDETTQEQLLQENRGDREESYPSPAPLQEVPERESSSSLRDTASPVDGEQAEDSPVMVTAVPLSFHRSSDGTEKVDGDSDTSGDREGDTVKSGEPLDHVSSTCDADHVEQTGHEQSAGHASDFTMAEETAIMKTQSDNVLVAERQQLNATSGSINASAEVEGVGGATENDGRDGKAESLEEGVPRSTPDETANTETPDGSGGGPPAGGSREQIVEKNDTLELHDRFLDNGEANISRPIESEPADSVSDSSAGTS